jgi:hypothetical protein
MHRPERRRLATRLSLRWCWRSTRGRSMSTKPVAERQRERAAAVSLADGSDPKRLAQFASAAPPRAAATPRAAPGVLYKGIRLKWSAAMAYAKNMKTRRTAFARPSLLPPVRGERCLRDLPDARTRHNRNSKPSAILSYGRPRTMASWLLTVGGNILRLRFRFKFQLTTTPSMK